MRDERTKADKLRDMAARGTEHERAVALAKLTAMGEPLTAPPRTNGNPGAYNVYGWPRRRGPVYRDETYNEELDRLQRELARARQRARDEQRAAQDQHRAERERAQADNADLERLLRAAGVRPGGGTQTFELDPDTNDFVPYAGPHRYNPDDAFWERSDRPRFRVTYSAQHGRPIEVRRRW